MKLLLQHGAKVDIQDNTGRTPLHLAALMDIDGNYQSPDNYLVMAPLSMLSIGSD